MQRQLFRYLLIKILKKTTIHTSTLDRKSEQWANNQRVCIASFNLGTKFEIIHSVVDIVASKSLAKRARRTDTSINRN